MAFKQYSLVLIARLLGVVLVMAGFVYTFISPQYFVIPVMLFVVLVLQVIELWVFLNRTNREVERLRAQIQSMEEELRRLYQSRYQLEQATKQNEKLVATLQEAKTQIEALRSHPRDDRRCHPATSSRASTAMRRRRCMCLAAR